MAEQLTGSSRRLVLSAVDLKMLTNWDDQVIEDYINILEDFIRTATVVDESTGDLTNLELRVDQAEVDIDALEEDVDDINSQLGLSQVQAMAKAEKLLDELSALAGMVSISKHEQEPDPQILPSRYPRLSIHDLTFTNTTANTNTPSGPTAVQVEAKDKDGNTIYLTGYGSPW